MLPRETLIAFDQFLAVRALQFEAVLIGGVALNLLGILSRPTKDCDILHPEIPEGIAIAARAFASAVRAGGQTLHDDWLNNGPASLARHLPPNWMARLQTVFVGEAILLRSLGRADLPRSKLFALCDRGIDLGDCLALVPSAEELATILPWLEQQDGNPEWPIHVRATLEDLGRRVGGPGI